MASYASERFLIRTAVTALSLRVASVIVPGLEFVGAPTTERRLGVIIVVAIICGVVNAVWPLTAAARGGRGGPAGAG